MKNDLIMRIVEDILLDPYFKDFKFRKRDFSLIKKKSTGYEIVELQNWESVDRNELALTVVPQYLKRFNILHKWFETFSFKSLQDQRDGYSIGVSGSMLDRKNQFFFLLSEDSFESDFMKFKSELITNSRSVFEKFSDLTELYDSLINPIIENKKELPNIGADWVFQYLTLTKIVNPNQYQNIKSVILDHIKIMNDKGEPNIIEYYPKINEIISYLEGLNLKNNQGQVSHKDKTS